MPSWSSFNSVISNRNLGIQQVEFMPVLPHQVTKYETVYTSLTNFKNEMAIFCDEGVFHIYEKFFQWFEFLKGDVAKYSNKLSILNALKMTIFQKQKEKVVNFSKSSSYRRQVCL